jgi:hypothetical protein
MAGHFKDCVGKDVPEREAGFFLANTITPIYKVVAAGAK